MPDQYQRLHWLMRDDAVAQTPAFVIDHRQLADNVALAADAVRGSRTRLLFAVKSFSIPAGLETVSQGCDGFHVSSLFEARLARRILGPKGLLHLTTPGLRDDEFDELCALCDFISFNSLSQWARFKPRVSGSVSCGLRVNPQLSLVADARYDPCRPHSKLGVPIDDLTALLDGGDEALLDGIEGVLVHSNCDAVDLEPLQQTVERLAQRLGAFLRRMAWINLGGGYLFGAATDWRPLRETIDRLEAHTDARVMFEPGAAVSRSGAHLVTRVLDVFDSGGRAVAVLDTSVNHLPEVFEYSWPPQVAGAVDDGAFRYLVAGATCLAGDLFGEFAFREPLAPGARLVLADTGAYSMVKANLFNGVNLPCVYSWPGGRDLRLEHAFTYDEFVSRSGAP